MEKVPGTSSSSGKIGIVMWEKRTVLLAAFGLVGFGALVGAGSAYIVYIKKKLEEQFRIQSLLKSQVEALKEDIEKLKNRLNLTDDDGEDDGANRSRPSLPPPGIRKKRRTNNRVSFVSGTKSDADEEFVTASESESEFDEDALVVYRRGTKKLTEGAAAASVPAEAGDFTLGESETAVNEFLSKIDKLFEGSMSDQHEAYVALKTNKEKLSDTYEFWWRFSKATHLEATAAGQRQDKELQKTLLEQATSYAQIALKLNEQSADAHKWYAITLGSRGEFLKINEKIQNGYVFKEHIDRAITLNPTDASLHHLVGRFCFEVAQLSWVERRIASTLFSEPPSSSVDEALQHFLTAERIGKPFIENRLYIAKCHISRSDYAKAAKWLKLASETTIVTANDERAHAEVSEILPKYRKYLTTQ